MGRLSLMDRRGGAAKACTATSATRPDRAGGFLPDLRPERRGRSATGTGGSLLGLPWRRRARGVQSGLRRSGGLERL